MWLIDASFENAKSVLRNVPYYPDEIWKFAAMARRFPEVVRLCKDCGSFNPNLSFCSVWMSVVGEDDFCSRSSEKETNNDQG